MTAPVPVPAPALLTSSLEAGPDRASAAWLHDALRRLAADPGALAVLFPAAGRACGHRRLPEPPPGAEGWTAADAARALLLLAVPAADGQRLAEAEACYRYGDAAERVAVLRALPLLGVGDGAVGLVEDALRTHDTRLLAAAVGPYARRHLDQALWRDAVLKCLFTGVPLSAVADLHERADRELRVMLTALVREREAAGRPAPPEALALLTPADVASHRPVTLRGKE
ncbi:EboA domain-containing protein [Kitasatospora sp. NPDC048545]|uniref:EboA domain-containing protein n=1 Tax=Kitasatospora sp. NPDC048545 TaxID=3157208 RepID=UPI0033F08711